MASSRMTFPQFNILKVRVFFQYAYSRNIYGIWDGKRNRTNVLNGSNFETCIACLINDHCEQSEYTTIYVIPHQIYFETVNQTMECLNLILLIKLYASSFII